MSNLTSLKVCILCEEIFTIYAMRKQKQSCPKCHGLLVTWKLTCRGICERYRYESQRYNQGIKRCTSCETYLEYDGVQCPCCRTHLRGKRKSKWEKCPLLQEAIKDEIKEQGHT